MLSDKTIIRKDLSDAVNQLMRSEYGRAAMTDLLAFLDNRGLSLDEHNQRAVFTLLCGAWGAFSGTARDLMRDALEA